VIDSLYRQVQKQRKDMAKHNNYITEGKKVINPHLPGNQKRQAIPNAKSAEKPGDKRKRSKKIADTDTAELAKRELDKRNIVVSFQE
jgi:hypothetical protein